MSSQVAAMKDLVCRAIDQREEAHKGQVNMTGGGFECAVWWEGKQLCIAIVKPTVEGAGQ